MSGWLCVWLGHRADMHTDPKGKPYAECVRCGEQTSDWRTYLKEWRP